MGGSIQCDLSFSTFNITGESIEVFFEVRTPHMIEEETNDNNMNYFLDTDINYFQVQRKESENESPLLDEEESSVTSHNNL